jgi:flagellin-like protein
MSMRKGITPIISVIILLVITVALAGFAYTYLQGFIASQTAYAFTIVPGGAWCQNSLITVYIQNNGQSNLQDEDFGIIMVDGTDRTASRNMTMDISPGKSGPILANFNCGGTCADGMHSIRLGVANSVQTASVQC